MTEDDKPYPRYGTKKFAKLLQEIKLAPCPFCGGKNISIEMEVVGTPSCISYRAWADCYECEATGSPSGGRSSLPAAWEVAVDAAESWNRRAPNAELTGAAKRLPVE